MGSGSKEWVSFLCSSELIAQMRNAVNQSSVAGLHQWIRDAIEEKIGREEGGQVD